MPMFSDESRSKLSTCHIDLQVIFFEVIRSVDCTILTGYRNEVDQNTVYENGKSTLKWPNSKHNTQPSMAVDVAPYPIVWSNKNRFYWFAGFVMGVAEKLKAEGKITHGLRYGGDWTGNHYFDDKHGLVDLTHFELLI